MQEEAGGGGAVTRTNEVNGENGIAGGKGANLGELTQAGIPVPPGFVVTAETYGKFMEDAGINGKVLDILAKTDINNTKELQAAAE